MLLIRPVGIVVLEQRCPIMICIKTYLCLWQLLHFFLQQDVLKADLLYRFNKHFFLVWNLSWQKNFHRG